MNDEKQGRIDVLEEEVRFYRNEWENACERVQYGQERIKELEAELERFKLRAEFEAKLFALIF